MFDHVGLHVKDIDASVRFYTASLAPLGHVPAEGGGFGPPDAPSLWLYADKAASGPGVHGRSARPIDVPSIAGMPPVSRLVAATMGRPACAPITARPTTPLSCSIPTATMSKRSA